MDGHSYKAQHDHNTAHMDKELINRLAEKEINKSAVLAAGCGAIPAPYMDIAGTIAVQRNMVKNLCELYSVEWNEHIVKGLIGSILGNIGKRTVASMVKSIPFIGTAVGGFANATLSYVSTIAMGKAFIKYMEVNKTVKSVKDIDLGVFTDMYKAFSSQASSISSAIKDNLMGTSGSKQAEQDPIITLGERVFGGREKFDEWLKKPHSYLGDRTPLSLLLSTKKEDHDLLRRLIELQVTDKVS